MNENNKKNIVRFSADEVILREGDMSQDMFKIIGGNVELYLGYGTKSEVLLGILGNGSCFGEFGLLLHKASPYTAVAYSEVLLYKVQEEKIGEFIRENHTNVLQMMRSMANSMMTMQNHINQLNEELDEKNKVNRNLIDRNKDMLKKYIHG